MPFLLIIISIISINRTYFFFLAQAHIAKLLLELFLIDYLWLDWLVFK